MIHLQLAPDVEFKMELDIEGVDKDSRDFVVQQAKAKVYAEFERRLIEVFPEGFKIDTFEFGVDQGWHKEHRESP